METQILLEVFKYFIQQGLVIVMVNTVVSNEIVKSSKEFKALYYVTYGTGSHGNGYLASDRLTVGDLVREYPWLHDATSIVRIGEVRVP